MVLLFSLPITEMSQKALKIRENYHIYEIFFVSLQRETIKQGTMQYREDKLCNYCKLNGNGCGQMYQGIHGRSECRHFEWDGTKPKDHRHWFWG